MTNVESGDSGITSVEHTTDAGHTFTVQSTDSKAEITESLKGTVETTDGDGEVSKAASEMGKKGGEASAKARAKAAREAKKAEKESKDAEPEDSGASGDGRAKDASGDDSATSEKGTEPARKDKRGDPRHDPTARVAEATRAASEARKELERERREKADLARRLAEVERRTATPEEKASSRAEEVGKRPEPPGKPKIEDFEDYESYEDAKYEWRRERERVEQQVVASHQQREQVFHQARVGLRDALAEAFGDADTLQSEVAQEVWDIKPTIHLDDDETPDGRAFVADEFMANPKEAPAFMRFFTEHPEEFQRIASLRTPREVTREMAKLPVTAATAGTSRPGFVASKAPPPIRPVSGQPPVAEGELYRDGMNLDQFASNWNKNKSKHLRR